MNRIAVAAARRAARAPSIETNRRGVRGRRLFGVSLLAIALLGANSGEIDPTFGGDGWVFTLSKPYDWAGAMAVQPDGKIIVVTTSGGFIATRRYLSSGLLRHDLRQRRRPNGPSRICAGGCPGSRAPTRWKDRPRRPDRKEGDGRSADARREPGHELRKRRRPRNDRSSRSWHVPRRRPPSPIPRWRHLGGSEPKRQLPLEIVPDPVLTCRFDRSCIRKRRPAPGWQVGAGDLVGRSWHPYGPIRSCVNPSRGRHPLLDGR